MNKLFTSESVSVGHPDFVASAIGDKLLDLLVDQDKRTRAGIEILVAPNKVVLAGEVTSSAVVDFVEETRKVVGQIGYDEPQLGFCASLLSVDNYIHQQSPDINQGVDRENGETGAGDQGIMFGYAANETEELYPLTAQIANEIMRRYMHYQKNHKDKYSPDAKSQVTLDYTEGKLDTILLAVSHKENVSEDEIRADIFTHVVIPALCSIKLKREFALELNPSWKDEDKEFLAHDLLDDSTKILINTTGKFVICGPVGDAGVMGRKIVVDSYGGHAHIGGGNCHGKDASKVDFSAAVASRYAAKNLVAAGVADKLEIQLAYAIGLAKPVSINVNTFNTNKTKLTEEQIAEKVQELFDFSPNGIENALHLTECVRFTTNTQYFFGVRPLKKDVNFDDYKNLHLVHTWEQLDKVDEIKKAFGL
jgi:S-adenosylmethionine synthetase